MLLTLAQIARHFSNSEGTSSIEWNAMRHFYDDEIKIQVQTFVWPSKLYDYDAIVISSVIHSAIRLLIEPFMMESLIQCDFDFIVYLYLW